MMVFEAVDLLLIIFLVALHHQGRAKRSIYAFARFKRETTAFKIGWVYVQIIYIPRLLTFYLTVPKCNTCCINWPTSVWCKILLKAWVVDFGPKLNT
jgi:hypothetical protein